MIKKIAIFFVIIFVYSTMVSSFVLAKVPKYHITSINKPDLWVEDVTLDPEIAWTADFERFIVVYFMIRNLGGVKANMDKTRHYVYRTDTNRRVGSLYVDDKFNVIEPGAKRIYKLVIPKSEGLRDYPGTIPLRLDVDTQNVVREDYLSNNSGFAKLIINPGKRSEYPNGYICSKENCPGQCINNVCEGINYKCSSLNCSGTCINNVCQETKNCTPQNCSGVCINDICRPKYICNSSNCSGTCVNNVCKENACNKNNCSGRCVNDICHIDYQCSKSNCKGTCKDNVCYASPPPGECKPFSYNRCRINLLEEKKLAVQLRKALEKEFQTDNIMISSNNWYKVVNAFIYGGYPVQSIAVAIRIGGKTVHTEIPWSLWRLTRDYKNNIHR